MLKHIKRQLSELTETLMKARPEIEAAIEQEKEEALINMLADAQEAAVALGNMLEKTEGETEPAALMIGMLEEYCETLWKITQEHAAEQCLRLTAEGWKLLGKVKEALALIPEQRAVVFMPYKSSMWDCMESVWQAACEDSDCVPYVVPIPYLDIQEGKVTAGHYEGGQFPSYVPIEDYRKFSLEEMHPSAIFIHNPFDGYNKVTTVLEQFYSAQLKKHTDRLVYIPYFIAPNSVYVTHRYIPSYENMDFIVVQTEKMIEAFSQTLSREKFLPCGNPIADRILRLEQEKPAIPETWKSQLKNGKDFGENRAVMLNTSISLLMQQKERFLDKIEYLFELAKRAEGIALVWRPHPLLHASAQSLGEKYASRLEHLERKFQEEKIGVLDKNPDVGVTVALCDAYLGETASSVIHMFGVAGKPRFYINLLMAEESAGCGVPSEEEIFREKVGDKSVSCSYGTDDRVFASAGCRAGETEYYVLDRTGWIVKREGGNGGYVPLVRIPGRNTVRGRAYRAMEVREGKLRVYPENAESIFSYSLETGRMEKLFESREGIGSGNQDGAERDKSDAGSKEYDAMGEYWLLDLDDDCRAFIRAERFQRGNLLREWYEGENSTVEDYFLFLKSSKQEELKGYQGPYAMWFANLDGSCGRKILQAVKDSIG